MPKNTTELFGLLSFLAILALFLHSVWKFSRRFPNADERAPTGVDGGLLLLMTGCVTLTVWFAATIAARAPLYARLSGWELLWTALPEALCALGFLWASLRIVTGRMPSVKTEDPSARDFFLRSEEESRSGRSLFRFRPSRSGALSTF